MTDPLAEPSKGGFSDPNIAFAFRDLMKAAMAEVAESATPTDRYGYVLDIISDGSEFPSANIEFGTSLTDTGEYVNKFTLEETADNPEKATYARVLTDDGLELNARISPEHIPLFRKAQYFDEENPRGSGVMIDSRGVYVNVKIDANGQSYIDRTSYPFLEKRGSKFILVEPQAAPRVMISGYAGSYYVVHVIRGVLGSYADSVAFSRSSSSIMPPENIHFTDDKIKFNGKLKFNAFPSNVSNVSGVQNINDNSVVMTINGPASVAASRPDVSLFISPTVINTLPGQSYLLGNWNSITLNARRGSFYGIPRQTGIADCAWVDFDSEFTPPPSWVLIFTVYDEGVLLASGEYCTVKKTRQINTSNFSGTLNYWVRGNTIYFECDDLTSKTGTVPAGTDLVDMNTLAMEARFPGFQSSGYTGVTPNPTKLFRVESYYYVTASNIYGMRLRTVDAFDPAKGAGRFWGAYVVA